MTTPIDKEAAALVDEGIQVNAAMKALTERDKEIKVALRKIAEDKRKKDDEDVTLTGNAGKAVVTFKDPIFKLTTPEDPIERNRVQAMLGKDIAVKQENVLLQEGVNLGVVKDTIGEVFYELFKEEVTLEAKSAEICAFLKHKKRSAKISDEAKEHLAFVEKYLTSKPNTPAVKYK